MGVREKIAAEEFTLTTSKSPTEIRDAGQRALESGKRFLTSSLKEGASEDSLIQYIASGPGGIIKQMLINVSWQDTPSGRQVTLKVPSYTTLRSTILFIPVSPKRAPALGSLRKFAASLKAELAA